MEKEFEEKEVKTKVAKRLPPGDRWIPLDNTTIELDSLTDVLEYIYQKFDNTQFYMDAREGFVYTIGKETVEKQVKPLKKYSLYGEN